jgi:RNA polymerase sigma-70 factor (ECF subfamily)
MTRSNTPIQDSAVFAHLFELYHLTVFRFIFGLSGGSLHEVEDLTAETFYRAWNARTRFDGSEQAALGWLLTIARHLVIDASRRQKVRHYEQFVADPDDWQDLLPINHTDNPEYLTIRREQMSIVLNLLSTLPTERRELLVLRYILGWQVKEIASHMNLSENTTSVYIRRAVEELRRKWPGD